MLQLLSNSMYFFIFVGWGMFWKSTHWWLRFSKSYGSSRKRYGQILWVSWRQLFTSNMNFICERVPLYPHGIQSIPSIFTFRQIRNLLSNIHQCEIQPFRCRGYQIFSMCTDNFQRYCNYNGNDEFRAYKGMAEFVCKDTAGKIQAFWCSIFRNT